MHRGVCWTTVHGVAKSRSRLSDSTTNSSPISTTDDVWYVLLVFKAFQSPSKNFQIQRYFLFFYLQAQWARRCSFSLPSYRSDHDKPVWKVGESVQEALNYLVALTGMLFSQRQKFFFLVRKTTSIHQSKLLQPKCPVTCQDRWVETANDSTESTFGQIEFPSSDCFT